MTISLIVINVIVAIISFTGLGNDRSGLPEIRRSRYLEQTRLYVIEMGGEYESPEIRECLYRIENSENLIEMQTAVIEIIGRAGGSINDYQEFENELSNKDENYFDNLAELEMFRDWKRYRAEETRIMVGEINYSYGLIPSRMNRLHTLITHMFLHGGLFHLIGNMIFLWVVGCLLEDTWGRFPFILFYLIGGVFAGIAFCLQDTSVTVPLIGASGAIAAAMGAFTVIHFRTRIKMFYFFLFFFRPYFGTFFLPAFVFLPLWFLQQVALKHLSDMAGGSNVAYIAHIAGYLFGVITALIFKVTGFEQRVLEKNVREKQIRAGITRDPRFDEGCRMMEKGMDTRAGQIFSKLIADRPDNPDILMDIAMIYREKGRGDEFEKLGTRALKLLLMKSRNSDAADWAMEMISGNSCSGMLSKLLMRVGSYSVRDEDYQRAFDIYDFIRKNSPSTPVSTKASIALAKLLFRNMDNPSHALMVLNEAREKVRDPVMRESIVEVESFIRDSFGAIPEREIPTL
ncbi:MAG: rhomboid family intramembrane serine protease [Candidatus Krumholzibacteriota bacterium]